MGSTVGRTGELTHSHRKHRGPIGEWEGQFTGECRAPRHTVLVVTEPVIGPQEQHTGVTFHHQLHNDGVRNEWPRENKWHRKAVREGTGMSDLRKYKASFGFYQFANKAEEGVLAL